MRCGAALLTASRHADEPVVPASTMAPGIPRPAMRALSCPGSSTRAWVQYVAASDRVVQDHDRRGAPVPKGLQQLEQRHPVPQVEGGRGLVEQQDLGAVGEGAGHLDAATLTAGQVLVPSPTEVPDVLATHGRGHGGRVRGRLPAEGAEVRRPAKQHYVLDGECEIRRLALRHVGQHPRALRGRDRRQVTPLQQDPPPAGRLARKRP
jgi:hypothetical protein